MRYEVAGNGMYSARKNWGEGMGLRRYRTLCNSVIQFRNDALIDNLLIFDFFSYGAMANYQFSCTEVKRSQVIMLSTLLPQLLWNASYNTQRASKSTQILDLEYPLSSCKGKTLRIMILSMKSIPYKVVPL